MELNSCSITGVKQMVFDYVHPTSPKTVLLAVFTSLHYTIVHMLLAFGVAVAIYLYKYYIKPEKPGRNQKTTRRDYNHFRHRVSELGSA